MKYLLLVCVEEPPESALETDEEIASWDVEGDDIKPWLAETGERGTRGVRQPGEPPARQCCGDGNVRASASGRGSRSATVPTPPRRRRSAGWSALTSSSART